ncbi:hypothetical protein CRG98_035815, partial [Punica granatum]
MVDSSFEFGYSSSDQSLRLHYPTPAASSSFTPLSSHQYLSPNGHLRNRRSRQPPPAAAFASDDDTSWQSEVSWQFEPSGWRDGRDLGGALSPWPAAATPSRSRIFRRTANEYYMSRTASGLRSFANPCYEYSGYGEVLSGRLELQSFVGRGYNSNGSSFSGKGYGHGENSKVSSNKASGSSSGLGAIKESGNGNGSALPKIDELGIIVYDTKELDDVDTDLVGPHRSHAHDNNDFGDHEHDTAHDHGRGHHRHSQGEHGHVMNFHKTHRDTNTDDNDSSNDHYGHYDDLSRGMHHHGHHR